MKQNLLETIMGAVVIVVALIFVLISYRSGNIGTTSNTYPVYAKFNEVGSVAIGSDVRIGGIKIGTVSEQSLEDHTYRAVLEFAIKNNIKLPKDSSAAIVSDGLIGSKYVAIIPGSDNKMIPAKGEVKFTQDSISLEALIGKFAFGSIKDDGENEDSSDQDLQENAPSDTPLVPSL